MEREYAVEVVKQILVQTNRVFGYTIVTTLNGNIAVSIDLKNNFLLQSAIIDIAKKHGLTTEQSNGAPLSYTNKKHQVHNF
jgi:hypothetical protein